MLARTTILAACLGIGLGVGASGERSARADFDLQLTAGPGVSWIRTMPSLSLGDTTLSSRSIHATDVAIGGGVTAIGGSFDLAGTIDDHVVLPILGMGVYGAVGDTSPILTSIDGSIARIRPWTTYQIDGLLPGFGYRVKRRRFMFSAVLRTGFTYLESGGSIAAGAENQLVKLSGVSFDLQAELEACRRLDPETRVCLQIAPRIYDFSGLNGATMSLRMEWGR